MFCLFCFIYLFYFSWTNVWIQWSLWQFELWIHTECFEVHTSEPDCGTSSLLFLISFSPFLSSSPFFPPPFSFLFVQVGMKSDLPQKVSDETVMVRDVCESGREKEEWWTRIIYSSNFFIKDFLQSKVAVEVEHTNFTIDQQCNSLPLRSPSPFQNLTSILILILLADFKCSAKTGDGIQDIEDYLIQLITHHTHERYPKSLVSSSSPHLTSPHLFLLSVLFLSSFFSSLPSFVANECIYYLFFDVTRQNRGVVKLQDVEQKSSCCF